MTRSFIDHINRNVSLEYPPKRIISLCPSITETLFALDLPGEVIGRTRYCIHPSSRVEEVVAVGGTKQVDFDLIGQLDPDLIIAEKEENPKEMIEALEKHYPVYVVNVENTSEAFRMIRDLGGLCGNEKKGYQMAQEIEEEWSKMEWLSSPQHSVAYFIWRKPYMVAGNRTYIHSVLNLLGLHNAFAGYTERYPMISIDDLEQQKPDFIFLSSEPFPFKDTHADELKRFFPQSHVVFVDGEMFSWYGVRMKDAIHYFKQLVDTIKMR